jgi:hypothetical protein
LFGVCVKLFNCFYIIILKKFLPLIHIPGVSSEVQKVLNKHKTEIRIAPNNIKTIKKLYTNTKQKLKNEELSQDRP